jgi:hypothetical protein
MALLMVEAFTPPGEKVDLVVDCQALVHGFQHTDAKRHDYRNKFAGFWHTAHHVIKAIHKVKSHMTRAQATELDQVLWWQGNSFADLQANLALPRHQDLELDEFLKAHKQQKTQLKAICTHLAAIEKLHPMAALLKQHPRSKQAAQQARTKARHTWTWQADRRICTVCGMAPRRRQVPQQNAACPGPQHGLQGIHPTHSMRCSQHMASEQLIVFCKACGKYGQNKVVQLRHPCKGHVSQASTTAHKRLMAGIHPISKCHLSGHVAWLAQKRSLDGEPACTVPGPSPTTGLDDALPQSGLLPPPPPPPPGEALMAQLAWLDAAEAAMEEEQFQDVSGFDHGQGFDEA